MTPRSWSRSRNRLCNSISSDVIAKKSPKAGIKLDSHPSSPTFENPLSRSATWPPTLSGGLLTYWLNLLLSPCSIFACGFSIRWPAFEKLSPRNDWKNSLWDDARIRAALRHYISISWKRHSRIILPPKPWTPEVSWSSSHTIVAI